MADIGVRFYSSGYRRVIFEMDAVEGRARGMGSGFSQFAGDVSNAEAAVTRSLSTIGSGAKMVIGVMGSLAAGAIAVVGAFDAMAMAIGTKFIVGLFKAREQFYLMETSLEGVIKSQAMVQQISDWAAKYAATYPAMYTDVMQTMKGLAMIPAMKPMFLKGDVDNMEKMMNIIQGLAAMDPQQGVQGAIFALREALSGQWRSMQMRFELQPEAIAGAGGMTFDEIKSSPEKAIRALDAFIKLNVGADTLRKTALSLGIQWGNLSDKYVMWLNQVGRMGVYETLVRKLLDLNEVWDKVLSGDKSKQFGLQINTMLVGAMNYLQQSMGKGIDLDAKSLFGNLEQLGRNAATVISEGWLANKELIGDSAKLVMAYVAYGLVSFVKHVFVPVGVEIGKAIAEGLQEAAKEHPVLTTLGMAGAGAVAGARFGIWGMLGGAAFGGTAGAAISEPGKGKPLPYTLEGYAPGYKPGQPTAEMVGPQKPAEGYLDKIIREQEGKVASRAGELWKQVSGNAPDVKALEQQKASEDFLAKLEYARAALKISMALSDGESVRQMQNQVYMYESLYRSRKAEEEWLVSNEGQRAKAVKLELTTLQEQLETLTKQKQSTDEIAQKIVGLTKEQRGLDVTHEEKVPKLEMLPRAETERQVADAMAKQMDITEKIKAMEKDIVDKYASGKAEVNEIADLEMQLLETKKKKEHIEREYLGLLDQQHNAMVKMAMIQPKAWMDQTDQLTKYGQTFEKFAKNRFSAAQFPGSDMTWGEAANKNYPGNRGIPGYMLSQEQGLKGQLEQATEPAVQKMLLQKLYDVNVQQFGMAKGTESKTTQFTEATDYLNKLMGVDLKLTEDDASRARMQAENIAKQVQELQTGNGWLQKVSEGIERLMGVIQNIAPSNTSNRSEESSKSMGSQAQIAVEAANPGIY